MVQGRAQTQAGLGKTVGNEGREHGVPITEVRALWAGQRACRLCPAKGSNSRAAEADVAAGRDTARLGRGHSLDYALGKHKWEVENWGRGTIWGEGQEAGHSLAKAHASGPAAPPLQPAGIGL